MKRALFVLLSYLLAGLALFFASSLFPVESSIHQWLRFFGMAGMGVPAVLSSILLVGLPHELGHIFVGRRLGYEFYGLGIMGVSWFKYGLVSRWSMKLSIEPVGHRILVKKDFTISELRLVLVAGPVASVTIAALLTPLFFFPATHTVGLIAVNANLIYGLASALPSDSYNTDGTFLLLSYKDPNRLSRLTRGHYDRVAQWLRPSGYNLEPVKVTKDPNNNCYQNLNWYWTHLDSGNIVEAEPYIREALNIAKEHPNPSQYIIESCYEAAVFYRRFFPDYELAEIAGTLSEELDPKNEKHILVDGAKQWVLGNKSEAIRLWNTFEKNYLAKYPDLGSQVHGRDWFIRLRTEDMVFETDRLYARPWSVDDVEAAFEIYRKPEVNRYLGRNPKSLETTEEAQEMLERWVANQAKRPVGQGTWALVRKEDEKIIGTIMCKALPNAEREPSGEIEIGWHLDPEAWGYGYATEAGLAVAEYGFKKDPNLPRVLAVVYPENTASKKVASKVGMTHLGLSSDYYGMELELFELKRPE